MHVAEANVEAILSGEDIGTGSSVKDTSAFSMTTEKLSRNTPACHQPVQPDQDKRGAHRPQKISKAACGRLFFMARSVPVPSHNNIPPAAGPAVSLPGPPVQPPARKSVRHAGLVGTKHSPPPHLAEKTFPGGRLHSRLSKKFLGTPASVPFSITRKGCSPQRRRSTNWPRPCAGAGSTGCSSGRRYATAPGESSPQASQAHSAPSAGLQRQAHGAHRAAGILQKGTWPAGTDTPPPRARSTHTAFQVGLLRQSFSTSRLRCACASASQSACRRTF